MTFQLAVSLLPWIIAGCFLFLILYFSLGIWQRLVMLWYSLAIRYYLWRATHDLGRALRYQGIEENEEKDPEEMVSMISVHPEWKD
jgi:hypothetical protein